MLEEIKREIQVMRVFLVVACLLLLVVSMTFGAWSYEMRQIARADEREQMLRAVREELWEPIAVELRALAAHAGGHANDP